MDRCNLRECFLPTMHRGILLRALNSCRSARHSTATSCRQFKCDADASSKHKRAAMAEQQKQQAAQHHRCKVSNDTHSAESCFLSLFPCCQVIVIYSSVNRSTVNISFHVLSHHGCKIHFGNTETAQLKQIARWHVAITTWGKCGQSSGEATIFEKCHWMSHVTHCFIFMLFSLCLFHTLFHLFVRYSFHSRFL